MFDSHRFLLFFAAALLLAITPGPGIFYVLARTLAGGRREGFQSSIGTFFGGLFPVFAADLLVVSLATPFERKLKSSTTFRRRQRTASGLGMIGLGAYVALSDAK